MKPNLRRFFSGNYDSLPAAIAGFWIIQALCSHGGIGVSPDSVVYISTAMNIHDHSRINDFTNMPVMDFPAFYPVFLSGLLFLTGQGVMVFGPLLNGFLFAGIILLSGWLMDHFGGYQAGMYVLAGLQLAAALAALALRPRADKKTA